MSTTTHNPMDLVAALMDERARYEAWLSTLETRRSATPNHVYDRVRSDYEARLRHVLEQLAGRASELQERADTLRARVADLQRQEDAHRDERAEAELRAAVGEHTQERWTEIRERADAEIARLAAARHEVSSELERLKEVLAVARVPRDHGAGAPRPPAAPTVIPGPGSGSRRPEPEPLVRAADRPPGDGVSSNSFDELAFLKSVVGPRGTTSPEPAPAPRDIRAGHFDNSGNASAPPPSGSPIPPAPSPRDNPRRHSVEGVPAFLKDVPSEQVKTLRCQECGTMNYPTEWYCERCGGELAAM